jgi:hypothetical protein
MPADSTHNDPATSSNRDLGRAEVADLASSSQSTTFPPRTQATQLPGQHGTSRTASLSGGRVNQSSADVAYAPNPFLGVGTDSYDRQATGVSTIFGGHPPASPTSIASATNQSSLVSYPSDWDNSFGNFLDLVHAYEPQGVLAQQDPAQQLQEFNLPQTLSAPPTTEPEVQTQSTSETARSSQSTPRLPAPPPAPLRTALKRKAESSEPNSAESDRSKARPSDWPSSRNRTVSFSRMSKPSPSPSAEGVNTADLLEAQLRRTSAAASRQKAPSDNGGPPRSTMISQPSGNQGVGRTPGIVRGKSQTSIPSILPAEKVFPIQIGSELFRLSGASISSDGLYSSLPSLNGIG